MRESADSSDAALTTLPGVGPALAKTLERLGLRTVQDLWFHLPLRYEDRTRLTPIRDLQPGVAAQVEGRVEAVERGFRYRPQLRVAIGDDSRATLLLRFFHFNAAQANQLAVGARLRCYGEVRRGQHGLEMVHPQYRRVADTEAAVVEECLTPVYPVTEGLTSARLAGVIARALQRLPQDADLAQLALGAHPAQRRLAFEELLAQHLSLKRLRARIRAQAAPALRGAGNLRKRFLAGLPFAPTRAQARVAAEVARDIAKPAPMLRLVQGDVGSGKTVVAALAALAAVESGSQAALMAPTELLAEQHYRNFQKWMEPLGIEVVWLAGKLKGRARNAALAQIAASAQIAIGTHALMQEGVAFRDLALVIIDEQHRFGVHQRLALRDKGRVADTIPHQLVLTATPIPRTLAMTAYADLDVSVIDELPPGRTPVTTVAIASSRRADVIERIRVACAGGRQAYWVCTIIEESDLLQAQAAEAVHAELSAALPGLAIGLVHGRLKPAQKQAVMDAFAAGKLAVLVATTVIEVGVDVPNASLMIVENAERLGLAQLHQLRGRVGRGRVESSCALLYQAPLSAMARQRLDVLRATNDGFRIAEKDLELRGPGEVLGTRQTGQMALRIADLSRDAAMLPDVQRAGAVLLDKHPALVDGLIERWIGAATRYAGA
jgi:ATP-dependent DNA helicase RecG